MSQPFRVCVAGSRDFSDYALLAQKLDHLLKNKFKNKSQVIIISGCARGADRLGERYARDRSLPLEQYPADWDTHGRSAGYKRNEIMAAVSDACVIFWDGKSKGTKHMIDLCRKFLQVRVIRF